MAWRPITTIPTQYLTTSSVLASGYVLKAYSAGTSTTIPFATNSTGATQAATVTLNADGYPEVSGNIIIPHINETYKLSLYPTQAAADANTGAVWTLDNLHPAGISESALSALTALTLPTTSDLVEIYDASVPELKKITLANLLLALPLRGHIAGLTLSNNATDATNDIDIAVGECTDSTQAVLLKLAASLTKRLDAAWAVGTNQGGLDTGAIANDVYHVWLIRRSDTGVVDALLSASATAPTMPTSYDYKRRIGSVIRASAAILAFTQRGDEFLLSDPPLDINVTNSGTSAVLRTLTVPDGVKVDAIFNALAEHSATDFGVYISSPDQNDEAASESAAPLYNLGSNFAAGESRFAYIFRIRTNTSAQVRTRQSASGVGDAFRIATLGWVDYRDKND